MPTITHRVRVHFISISTTSVPIATHIAKARAVYAQYGIQIVESSGMSLMLSAAEAARFAHVDGQCRWNITAGEYREIQDLGNPVPATDISVYYVNRLSSGSVGCGGHMAGRPASIVAANGTKWTTAHEVGHVLLTSSFRPVHESSTHNLMYRSTAGITWTLPILTPAQVTQIKRSPCCVRIRSG
jgi:hypothetical protein